MILATFPEIPMPAPRSDSLSRLGCGYVLITILVTCVLLVLNGLIVTNVYQAAAPSLPDAMHERRWAQAIVFLGPVVMLAVQWWAYDVAIDWLWPRRSSGAGILPAKPSPSPSGRRPL